MNDLAPIVLFTYNRLEETRQTIESLQHNYLAKESNLFIFSDGAKNESSIENVAAVRVYLKNVVGFKSITIVESEKNKGLAKSIITGVTQVIEKHGKVIVVEDDLILSSNFLSFMNQSLKFYNETSKVFSVSGYCLKVNTPKNYSDDMFFWGRAHSWGWATWLDRWESIDWEIKDWEQFKKDKKAIENFNQYGTDLFSMLRNSMDGKVNSWFIRFTYNQFKQDRLTVYPILSKVVNRGFIAESTHCNTYNRNTVYFDKTELRKFNFSQQLEILKPFRKQLFRYKSYTYRIIGKMLTILMKNGIIKQKVQKI